MDIEEDNDEVEREIDIIYSTEFSNEAKLFQFPLIPKNSLNIERIKELDISEDKNSMKMEMSVDQKYLDKYDYNATPNHTLKGEKIESNTNLCLGMVKNDKLYLTPISQIFQFRHDFSNLEKEKGIQTKINKEKNEIKKLDLKKAETKEIKYSPLIIHKPDSIESKINLERMAVPEAGLKQADFMTKNEYFDLLMKYVITADSEEDVNEDYFLTLNKMNTSKESIENENDSKKENDMIIEEEIEKEKEKKSKKSRGFNSGLESIKSQKSEKKSAKEEKGNGIVHNIINKLFEGKECIYYNNLINGVCKKMNISNKDEEKVNQIKNDIEENCYVVKENICFLKDDGDDDIKDVRNLIIQEVGNNENGLKKQQIKKKIEENELNISDNKLTKLLQKLCKYQGNVWVIKSPS